MDRPVCLLVNPAAGGGRAGRAAGPALHALRQRHRLQVRIETTRDLPHARELSAAAARAGEAVVVLGGDGLIGAVADAVRGIEGALLGLLPGGRGNDLIRVLGIPSDPVQACAVVAEGESVALDLGEVAHRAGADGVRAPAAAGQPASEAAERSTPEAAGRAFVGIASVGFDSDANRFANEAPPRLGQLVYAYGALRALIGWRPARFELTLDGERTVFSGYSVGAANSKAYGGGMYAAPDASLQDGLLDVVFLQEMSKLRFLTRILPKVFKGTHVNEPQVRVLRGRELQIGADRPFTVYADGDPIGQLPVTIRALPAAVNVLLPPGTRP